jgi:predicted ATPase
MLERLYVDNYRCLVNFECHFKPKQLIVGPNGGGKTTLFDVLAMLRDFCGAGLQVDPMLMGFTRTRWQEVPTQTFELDVSGNEGLYQFRLVVDSWGHPARPRVVKEEVLYSGKPIFRFAGGDVQLFNDRYETTVKYPFDWHRSALATITERPENTKLSWFMRWLKCLWFFSADPHQMSPIADKEEPGPTRDLSNFANWYRHLRQESAESDWDMQEDLKEVIPSFQNLDLKEAGMGNRALVATFTAGDVNGKQPPSFAFNELSDGQRVLVGLYTILHFAAKPGMTLFFDEPDNFIALAEIQPWLDKLIDRVEESNAQVLIASHHPELLNRMAFEEGLLLDRPEGRHTRARPFKDSAGTGLSPAELVARGWEHE